MAAPCLALGAEIFSRGFRFLPTPEEAVTYYLPRLVAGVPLHGAVRPVVHRADVYACAPADLARRFFPLPRTGDRFFFTPCAAGRKRGRTGAARADGSWQAQSTVDIKARGGDGAGAKVGELRKLRYKKSGGGAYTDWLMDEYSCSSGGGGGESQQFALCKMYVSPRAAPMSAARQESTAFFFTLQRPPPAAASAVVMQPSPSAASKRPAPPLPAMSQPCAKRMRGPAVLRPAPSPQPPAPPAPTPTMPLVPPPPPRPSAPRRGSSATQPSPASAPSSEPPAPARPPLAAVRMMSFAPPQPSCAPRRVSTTEPSPASTPPLAPIRPAMQPHRSPMPLPAPPQPLPQKVPLPAAPPVAVVRACHVPIQTKQSQRRVLNPFEAAMLREQAEEQTVPAAPHPPPPPAATPALQDEGEDKDEDEDDWDDLDKALELL